MPANPNTLDYWRRGTTPPMGAGITPTVSLDYWRRSVVSPVVAPTSVRTSVYYVRKSGSDANDGTSAATAWATLGKLFLAATRLEGGDTIYIGAGIYREAITAANVTMNSPLSPFQIIGDTDGLYTGDGGPVIWTNWTTGDTSAAPNVALFNGNGRDYLYFSNMSFITGTVTTAMTVNGNHWRFTRCRFQSNTAGMTFLAVPTTQAVAKDLFIDQCVAIHLTRASAPSFVTLQPALNAVADYDAGVTIRNSLLMGWNNGALVAATGSGSGSYRGGGGLLTGCTLVWCDAGIRATNANYDSAQYPAKMTNCLLLHTDTTTDPAGVLGAVAESNYRCDTTATLALVDGLFTRNHATRNVYVDFGELFLWGLGNPALLGRPYPAMYSGLPYMPSAVQELGVGRGGTSTEDTSLGAVAWTGPGNVTLLADVVTAVSGNLAQNVSTYYLKLVGNLTVPSGATIKGIRVQVLANASAVSSVRASSVKLVKAGAIVGNDLASSNTAFLSTGNTALTFGSFADPLWGLTLSAADVNDPAFGCVVSFINTNAAARTVTGRGIRLLISYEDASGAHNLPTDFSGRPRPAGLRQATMSVGANEVHDTGERDATVARSGTASLKLVGPGDQQFDVPVRAVATTIRVYARYDAAHGATTKPQMVMLANATIGVAELTATMTFAVDTWELLTLGPFTPTGPGVVTVRLRSRSLGATGVAYFDEFAVTG